MSSKEKMNSSNSKQISYAKPSHVDAIFKIEKKCFPGSIGYSKYELAYLLSHEKSICLIETQGKNVRAFLIATYSLRSLRAKIVTVDVDPSFQNQGIGSRLLEKAEYEMKQKGMRWSELEVSENNKAAIALYTKAGYKFKEKIKDYYKSNHYSSFDALRMIKALS
jgi:ribosomal-protein-alanine N-acetyltransferase